MSETRMGVDPEDEPVSGTGVEQPDIVTEPTTTAPAADKSFSQADVDAIVSKRISEANQKLAEEMQQWQRANQERDAAILQLTQELNARRQQEAAQADPYAKLSPGQRELAEVNATAMEPFRREMNQALGQVAALVAPTLARDTVDDFFEARVPGAAKTNQELKARTLHWLKRGMNNGMNVDGAYRMALSEVAEKVLAGGAVTAPAQTQTASQPAAQRRQMPAVEVGSGRRNITQPLPNDGLDYTGIDTHDPARNLKAWFRAAETMSTQAPDDGAMVGRYGAKVLSDTKPPI